MIVNLFILFCMLFCFYRYSVDSFQETSVVNEKYRIYIFRHRNLIEEDICYKNKNYWVTSCKEVFRKIRETEVEYRYSLYVNYPLFHKVQIEKCQIKPLMLYERINEYPEEPPQYALSEKSNKQLMVPCFSTGATIPSGTEENDVVSDVIEFWIYPGNPTSWMLIKYDSNTNAFALVDWLDNIQINDDDLVPSIILSLPIPTSITDKNQILEKLKYANDEWSKWIKYTKRSGRNILTKMKPTEATILCLAFIGQYLHKEEKFTKFSLQVTENNSSRLHRRTLLGYVSEPDQSQEIQMYDCPVTCNDYSKNFKLAWGKDEKSILLVRFNENKRKHGKLMGEIVEMIENVDNLHIRHLYFNNYV